MRHGDPGSPQPPKIWEEQLDLWLIDQFQRGPGSIHPNLARKGHACPEEVADYLFCESVGFRVLPWELDDLPVDITVYWANVIGKYMGARNENEAKARARVAKKGR